MSIFKFRFRGQDGDVASDESYEFSDLFTALAEARRVLGEMALERATRSAERGLGPVLDPDGLPVTRVGLAIRVDFLAS
jgi:hypothetical protein